MIAAALMLPPCASNYASSERSMIIGGSEASDSRYPYAAYLMYDNSPFCGGSLIASDVVLSAGHCLTMTEGVQPYTVVIGRHNVTHTDEGEEFTNAWGIPHPDYNLYKGDDNDFGLIFLPNRTQQDTIVRLNKDDDVPIDGQMLTYFGWGVTDQNSTDPPVSDVPLEIETATISNEECSAIDGVYMGHNETYNGYITDNMICTLAFDKDSCQRDSGGPEIVKGSNATTDLQVGVISWGLGCATNIFPGVSARISKAYEWIRTEVCNRSAEPPSDFECQTFNEANAYNNSDPTTTFPNAIPTLSSSPSANKNDVDEEESPSPSPNSNENAAEVSTAAKSGTSSCIATAIDGEIQVMVMLLLWFGL